MESTDDKYDLQEAPEGTLNVVENSGNVQSLKSDTNSDDTNPLQRPVKESQSHSAIGMNLVEKYEPKQEKNVESNTKSSSKNEDASNGSNSGSNSGLVSLGNNSFGFNFDSEEGTLTNGCSPPTSESDGKNGGSDSDGDGGISPACEEGNEVTAPQSGGSSLIKPPTVRISKSTSTTITADKDTVDFISTSHEQSVSLSREQSCVSSSRESADDTVTKSYSTTSKSALSSSKSTISSLTMSAPAYLSIDSNIRNSNQFPHTSPTDTGQSSANVSHASMSACGSKHNHDSDCGEDNESMEGYNSDDEGVEAIAHPAHRRVSMPLNSSEAFTVKSGSTTTSSMPIHCQMQETTTSGSSVASLKDNAASHDSQDDHSLKKRKVEDCKREERNAREKERSSRIAKQISELRSLLSSGGVIVPKGTKSSVLTEAASYIRMLQQHQQRSEIDRHHLIQQMQQIGNGALGTQAANAIRHVAAQNGVWALGNFGGLPPQSTVMTSQKPQILNGSAGKRDRSQESSNGDIASTVDESEYRQIFNSCSVAMAIATLGGLFIDCNSLFSRISQYTKQEVCAMTIFTLTSREDLQVAFDLISQMISPSSGISSRNSQCVFRGSLKHRKDLGLSISLIKGEDGIAKYFCVTLIRNPSSPFDTSPPVPATADMLVQLDGNGPHNRQSEMQKKGGTLSSSPAFMSG